MDISSNAKRRSNLPILCPGPAGCQVVRWNVMKRLVCPVPELASVETAPLPKDRQGQASALASARLQFWQLRVMAGAWLFVGTLCVSP